MIDPIDYWTSLHGTDVNTSHPIAIQPREFWKRCPKAVARKVTADGVSDFGLDTSNGNFRVIFVSGYTHDRGWFYDFLDEKGRAIPWTPQNSKSFRFGGGCRTIDWDALDYAEGRCLGDTVE